MKLNEIEVDEGEEGDDFEVDDDTSSLLALFEDVAALLEALEEPVGRRRLSKYLARQIGIVRQEVVDTLLNYGVGVDEDEEASASSSGD